MLATLTWRPSFGANPVWSAASNWDANRAPAAGDDLVFPANSAATFVRNDLTGLSIRSLQFDAGYSVTGNALTLGSGGISVNSSTATVDLRPSGLTLASSMTIAIASGATLNFLGNAASPSSGPLAGAGAFTKVGEGNLVFYTQLTSGYTATPAATAGTITIGTSTAIPAGLTLSSAATMELGTPQTPVTFTTGSFSGGGSIYGYTSTDNNGVITGSSGFGATRIEGGTFQLDRRATFTAGTIVDGYFTLAAGTVADIGTIINGDFILESEEPRPSNGFAGISTELTVARPGFATFTLQDDTSIIFKNDADTSYNGTIFSAYTGSRGTIVKDGRGTLTYNASLGGTPADLDVRLGRFSLGSDSFGAYNRTINVAAGATFDLNGHALTAQKVLSSGTVALTNASLTVNGSGRDGSSEVVKNRLVSGYSQISGAATGSGGFITAGTGDLVFVPGSFQNTGSNLVNAGGLILRNGAKLAGRVSVSNAGRGLSILGNVAGSSIGSLAGNGNVSTGLGLTVGTDGTDSSFSGTLSSSFADLTKSGAGTLTLDPAGKNFQLNRLVVNGGTVLLASAGSSSFPVQVNSGGTLRAASGFTTIGVASGGTLAPGTAVPGTLQVNGAVSLASGATLALRINGASFSQYDQVYDSSFQTPVGINGANLKVSFGNGYVPAVGSVFSIMNGYPINGIFAGLPDGTVFNGGGVPLKITYIHNFETDAVFLTRVAATATAVVTSTPGGSTYGQSVTFRTGFTPSVAGLNPTGTVQYQVDGANFGAPVPIVNGAAVFSTSELGAGTHSIRAVYSGDAIFAGTAATTTQVVARAQLRVKADDKYVGRNREIPALTYSLVGLVNGDTSGVLVGSPGLSTAATSSSPLGNYPITVALRGATAANYDVVAVNGNLTVAPTVVDVRARYGSRSISLLGLGRDLPFLNIGAIDVIFSDDVEGSVGAMAIAGRASGLTAYSPAGYGYSRENGEYRATWQFSAPLGAGRLRLLLDGDPTAADGKDGIRVAPDIYLGDYSLDFDVLPGDYNGDGIVNTLDTSGISAQVRGVADPLLAVWADINGDGVVTLEDFNRARTFLGKKLS